MDLVGFIFVVLPSAAGGKLTRHPCEGAVQQLGLLYGYHLKTRQMPVPGCCGAT